MKRKRPAAGSKSSRDPRLAAVLRECMNAYGIGRRGAEWPNNILSRRTVVYVGGVIARQGESPRPADPAETANLQRLAEEAARIMGETRVGMGSESDDPFRPFYLGAPVGEPLPPRIDAGLIRARFGGTIFPPATVGVEPLAEAGAWWSAVQADAAAAGEAEAAKTEGLRPWRAMIAWFRDHPAFRDTSFVRIGDYDALRALEPSAYPPGTEMVPGVLPRLILGLTPAGGLAGLFGFMVQT